MVCCSPQRTNAERLSLEMKVVDVVKTEHHGLDATEDDESMLRSSVGILEYDLLNGTGLKLFNAYGKNKILTLWNNVNKSSSVVDLAMLLI